MRKPDDRTAENLRKDPAKHEAFLERKRRQRKRKQARTNFETERKRRWRAANPDATQRIRRANHAVDKALRDGVLTRPDSCSDCGTECRPEAHHESYAIEDWIKVVWLCSKCHAVADGRSQAMKEKRLLGAPFGAIKCKVKEVRDDR